MKKNRLYTVNKWNKNLFDDGGTATTTDTPKAKPDIGGAMMSMGISTAINAADALTGALADGRSLGKWDGVADSIPVLGGLFKAAFGIKTDQEKLNAVNSNVAKLNTFDAKNSFDDIQGIEGVSFDTKVYEGGWAKKSKRKARRKNEALKTSLKNAADLADRNLSNNISNIAGDQTSNALANYAAFGGLVAPISFGGGALDIMQNNKYIDAINARTDALAKTSGFNIPTQTIPTPTNTMADGGNLEAEFLDSFGENPIAAAIRYNRGLEKMAAEKELAQEAAIKEAEYNDMKKRITSLETENQTLQTLIPALSPTPVLPLSLYPDVATADNEASSYAFGGELGTNGTDWTNGLLNIDEGGSHEENPMEGVQLGLDPQGIPNLVEEGETVFNNYVFSKRLKVPAFMKKELGLRRGKKDISFAEASKILAKESEKRPNDPISRDGLEASLAKLAEVQEAERAKKEALETNYAAKGGKLKNKYANAGTFQSWWDNNMLANPIMDYSNIYKNVTGEDKTFDNADDLYKALEGVFNTNPEKFVDYNLPAAVSTASTPAVTPLEQIARDKSTPTTKVSVDPNNPLLLREERVVPTPTGDDIGIPEEAPVSETTTLNDEYHYPTWMRYAPVVGAGALALTDALGLTNKPDYSAVKRLEAAANQAAANPEVSFNPIGNYLTYKPMDIWYEQNRLNANARATDRQILNSGANQGQKMAGLLASGYNNQIASGDLFRKALEYNDAKRQAVEDFNRKTDMFNSQMGLEADMANAKYRQHGLSTQISGLAHAAALRNAIDERISAARTANITNLLESLGNIGRENFALNQIESSKAAHNNYTASNTGRGGRDANTTKRRRWFKRNK